jgi:kynureninase
MRIDKLREAYPNLTDKQEAIWSKTFGIATSVDTKVKYGAITRTDDRAEVDFTLNVSFRYANGTRGSSPPARQHATLQNTSSGWKIVEIR